MKRKILFIVAIALFSLGLTVLANSVFEIDDAFFDDTTQISSGDYSPLHFNFAGNDLDGMIFWGEDNAGNTGEIIMGSDTITCNQQLRGLYINTARGNKIWPIDQITLNELRASSTLAGYDQLDMTGGFFTQCTGNASTLGYTVESDDIYGYITHSYNGEDYELRAGIDYDFGAGVGTGVFSGSIKYITGVLNNTAKGYLFDDHGGIATVISSQDIYGNISFTGNDVSLSGAQYYATQAGIQVTIYSNLDVNFEITGDVASSINGNLNAGVSVDQNITLSAGNGPKTITLIVDDGADTYTDSVSLVLSIPDTTAPVVSLSYPSNGAIIANNSINFQWNGSDNIGIDHYSLYISGDTQYTRDNLSLSSQIVSPILNGDYTWYVVATDTSGNTGYSSTYSLVVSGIIAGPDLISPLNGADVNIGELNLSRSNTNSASGYTWQIASDSTFGNLVATGDTTSTSVYPIHRENFMLGTFYWRVIDNEKVAVSDYRFVHIVEPSDGIDLQVDNFHFDDKDDATLSESYKSNKITIAGITNHVYIPIKLENNIGALFINDVMVGSQGYVQKGDEVYIELFSSNKYDDRTKSTMIIGEGDDQVDASFYIYTIQGHEDTEFELTYRQKLQAILLIDSLTKMYEKNPEKLEQFLTTFKAILQDKSDVLTKDINHTDDDSELELLRGQKASIEYLLEVIDKYLSDLPHNTTSIYIAPNGKQYLVQYDTDRLAYTSPDFVSEKYFPTWDLFTHHIDSNNPAMPGQDTYHNSDNTNGVGETITAPNSKIYQIYQINGKRTSDEFTYKKYFDTRAQIVNYIFVNNPSETWNHKIDTSFTPVYFVAPNGKRYTIFKTSSLGANPNKYSSFGFVTAKYFDSLQAAKDHIVEMNR